MPGTRPGAIPFRPEFANRGRFHVRHQTQPAGHGHRKQRSPPLASGLHLDAYTGSGKHAGQPFEEETQTISVSAHGGLLRVAAKLVRGQAVSIVNAKTAEELPCTVTSLGQKENGKTEVGVEFTEASPLFWRIAFPPEDWDPSERKRPGSTHHRPSPPPLPKR